MQQFEKYGDGTKIKKLVKNLVRQKKLNFLFRVMNIKFFYNSL